MAEGILRIGTCSWKYPSWVGLVYSRAGIDYLTEYAARYSSVEIDQWFWAMPVPAVAESYAGVVPSSFRFSVKAFNGLTRATLPGRKGQPPKPNPDFLSPELFAQFLEALGPLRAMTGVVMLQFEYLNKQKMASEEEFLRRLDSFLAVVPRDIPIAVETRNPNYLGAPYFKLLRERRVGHVFLQGYWMPPVAELYERCRELLLGPAVVRLHGPDREGMEVATGGAWDRIVTPHDDELHGIAAMSMEMRKRGLDVYLNVNNHYEGSAPLTIQKLLALGVSDSTPKDPAP